MTESTTLLLYCTIIIVSFFLASLSQNRKYIANGEVQVGTNKLLFLSSFLIPWFFFAFAGMSNDYAEYQHIFNVVTWDNFYRIWIEPGYALLNLLIKTAINDSVVGIVIIKSIIMVLVYKTIYDYRNKIPVGLAVLGFLCYCYLDAFCMIRINLAAAIVLFAFSRFDLKNATKEAVILLVIAFFIHYSTFIVAIAVFGYIFCTRKKRISLNAYLVMVACLLVCRLVAIPLMNLLFKYIPVLAKYGEKYDTISRSGSGLLQYIIHIPLLFVFHQSIRSIVAFQATDHNIYTIGMILAPFSLFFGTMGYSVQVIGRSFVFFLYLWIITVPCFYRTRCNQKVSDKSLVYLLIIIWLVMKFVIYLQSDSLVSSGIAKYYFIWQVM